MTPRPSLDRPTDQPPLPDVPPETLRVVPLGGVGEFGKNMMALEYGDDMIVVDCGIMFPEQDMLGVDAVINDFTYISDRLDKLQAVILTHGHEDHIGGIPYLLRDYDVPVYGSRLTLAFVRDKLREHEIEDCELIEVHGRSFIRLGAFEIEFVHVSHSIPEAMSLAINLPIGTVIHTGDYKFDPSDPADTADYYTFAKYGEQGVLLLMADSTNSDRKGHSPSEEAVRDGLRPIIATAPRTVVLSTFSSHLHRIQIALDLARELGRTVFIAGYSIERNFATATKLGLLDYPEKLVKPLKEIDRFRPDRRLVIATGSQGEPLSVLSRMALDDYRPFRVAPDDLIIFSSRIIPGNERSIYKMINHLYRRGARIVTENEAMVHASGHACQGEMIQLYNMIRPKFFMPIHGELRQLFGNREMAVKAGIHPENIAVLENGSALDITREGFTIHQANLAGQMLVDGKVFDQLEEVVLRDRKHLSEDGMLLVILVIDRKTLRIIAGPDIVSRGFVEVDANADLMEECKEVVRETFEASQKESKEEWDVIKTSVRKALRRFLRDETDRYPVIIPVVIEI